MISELLQARELPAVWPDKETDWEIRREELKELLCQYEYGHLRSLPDEVQVESVREQDGFASGKAVYRQLKMVCRFGDESFSFPFLAVIPKEGEKLPFFVHIAFGEPSWDIPIEEIVDRGFGYLAFNYQEVTVDDDMINYAHLLGRPPYPQGIWPYISKNSEGNLPGKLAVWAWAASRVLDYAETIPALDPCRAAVVGHSRLGKTALFAGMMDERFQYVIPNDSGCGGASLYRGIKGEDLDRLIDVFPYWLTEAAHAYKGRISEYPADQHFLIAACAPRKVYVSAADADMFADADSMYLACCAASEVYEALGMKGFVHPDRLPETGDVLQEGEIAFHMKKGPHSLGREDWNRFMDYIGKCC